MDDFEIIKKTPAQKAAERAERELIKKDTEALRHVLHSEKGRWFIMRLFESCHIFSSTFPDSDHTNRMLIHEGERRIALNIERRLVEDMESLSYKAKAEKEYFSFFTNMQKTIKAAEMERNDVNDF